MEFERPLSRQLADSTIESLQRAWVARSDRHLAAYECALCVVVRRSMGHRNERLGLADSILLVSDPGDANIAMTLLERARKYTSVNFLGIAPRSAVFEREGGLWISMSAFGEPKTPEKFKVRAPVDIAVLSHYDLNVEAQRGLTRTDSTRPDLVYLRLYLLVFCFHDDDERYGAIRASVQADVADHLDQLRERCSDLELGPVMSKIREELRRETS